MESNNSTILIVALVAIVGIVSMTVFMGNSGSNYGSSVNYAMGTVGGNAMSTGSVCGNGIVEQEECDAGRKNGIVCTAGYNQQCTYCTNKCIPGTIIGPVDNCYDSDGGYNINTAGYVNGTQNSGSGFFYSDYCNNNMLTEMVCNGPAPGTNMTSCMTGSTTTCQDGRCI